MKIKRPALACLAVIAAMAMMAISGSAQHMGFQIAIASTPTINQPIVVPGFSQPMTVPFTGHSTFGFVHTQPQVFVTGPGVHPFHQFQQVHPFHHGNTVVVVSPPQHVILPGHVVAPGVVFGQPQGHFGPPVARTIPVGTPRAHVLAQLGQPSVTIVTRTGETMHFNGGVTVILHDGRVVTGPR